MTTKQHVPVFVSSTYEDMKPYRGAVKDTLHRMETIVHGMEYFGSMPGSPKEECLKVVKDSKVYIGLFAMRYGSIDDETGKSMTHLELEEAEKLGLPILVYLIDEDNQPIIPKFIDTGENAIKLQNLKNYLKKKYLVSFFTTTDDLARRISQDLPPILKNIGIEINNVNSQPNDTNNVLYKFLLRPKKYSGYEVTVEGSIISKPETPDHDVLKGFRMSLGDTIKRSFSIADFKEPFQLYAEDKMADTLESFSDNEQVKVLVKLMFGIEVFSVTTDEGKLKREIPRTGFKLLKIIK